MMVLLSGIMLCARSLISFIVSGLIVSGVGKGLDTPAFADV